MERTNGFTLVDAAIMVGVVLVMGGFVFALPELNSARKPARQMQSNTQLGGIHSSLVAYSQGNRGWYPGLNDAGKVVDVSNQGVFKELLTNNYFSGEYAVSPAEGDVTPWVSGQDEVTTDNLSYAILDVSGIDDQTGRFEEWRDTTNTRAAVLSDRNTAKGDARASVWTPDDSSEGWHGGVAWNDNHVELHKTHVMQDTRYGDGGPWHEEDDLFAAEGDDDALMTFHKGENGKEATVPTR